MKTFKGFIKEASGFPTSGSIEVPNNLGGSIEVNPDAMIASMGADPNQVDDSVKNIFTKDYRKLMKAVDKKSNQTRNV